jgi:hypothetical protein
MSAQVHIQPPEDGDTVLPNFTASGRVRPRTHEVKLTLYCGQNGQSSVATDAVVDHNTGEWTAGPFRKADGNLLSPGGYASLSAISFSPQGVSADTDNVGNLTIL